MKRKVLDSRPDSLRGAALGSWLSLFWLDCNADFTMRMRERDMLRSYCSYHGLRPSSLRAWPSYISSNCARTSAQIRMAGWERRRTLSFQPSTEAKTSSASLRSAQASMKYRPARRRPISLRSFAKQTQCTEKNVVDEARRLRTRKKLRPRPLQELRKRQQRQFRSLRQRLPIQRAEPFESVFRAQLVVRCEVLFVGGTLLELGKRLGGELPEGGPLRVGVAEAWSEQVSVKKDKYEEKAYRRQESARGRLRCRELLVKASDR